MTGFLCGLLLLALLAGGVWVFGPDVMTAFTIGMGAGTIAYGLIGALDKGDR